MSNQRQASPLPENSAEEEEEEVVQQQQEDQLEEEEDKNLQEPSQEPPRGGGDERKVASLPPSAQKTSIARNGPVRKPYVANRIVTRSVSANLKAMSLKASKKLDSPRQPLGTPAERPLENSAKDGVSQGKEKKIKDKVHGEDGEGQDEGEEEEEEDKNLQEPSQEPTDGGDERKVATLPPSAQKTSIARKGPILKPCAANAMGSDPIKEMITRAIHEALASLGVPVPVDDAEEEDSNSIMLRRAIYFASIWKANRLASNNFLDSVPPILGTPDKRPLENSAKDGVSQGKEKMIKDKVHGEDGEEGEGEGKDGEGEDGEDGEGGEGGEGDGEDEVEGGGEENPREDSASI